MTSSDPSTPTLWQRAAYARHSRLFAPPSLSWNEIVERVAVIDPIRIGVDLWDTVLIRRVVGPDTIMQIVGAEMVRAGCWPGTVEEWHDARSRAEAANPTGGLVDWFQHMAQITPHDTARALEIEETLEAELALAVPGAKRFLADLRSIAPIVFVSDMHLSGKTLEAILENHGLIAESEMVVVSCEQGASKSEGNLFAKAFSPEELRSGRSVFIGNDLWSDVTMAQSVGLNIVPALAANPDRFEDALGGRRANLGSAVAAAARLTRLEYDERRLPDDDVRALGASVLGQMMTAFLIWAEDQCRSKGIQHLEFLARDGEVPLAVANAMPRDHWEGMTLDYLHCGRRVWSLAAVPLVGAAAWISLGTADDDAFLLHSGTTAPFSALLDRCGLEKGDLPIECPLHSADEDAPLSSPALAEWAILLSSGDLDEVIAQKAQKPCDEIVDFLRQRGLPSGRIALVDVGWRGQQAWMISALVREATGQDPLHLHFGGDLVMEGIDQLADIERFALDDSVRPHPIQGPVSCLEMLLSSDAPRLIGYERSDAGPVVEVFSSAHDPNPDRTRGLLAEGACAVAERVPDRSTMDSWFGASRGPLAAAALADGVRALMVEFWNSPMPEEARSLRRLRFEVDDVGDVSGPVVRPYSLFELRGRSATPRQWPQGSLVLTPWITRTLMRPYLRLKRSTVGAMVRNSGSVDGLMFGSRQPAEDGPESDRDPDLGRDG